MTASWEKLNALSDNDAHAALMQCCGSKRWVKSMMARRPFASAVELTTAADLVWSNRDRDDWLEAFAAHPRIGDLTSLRQKFASTAHLCGHEQAAVASADEQVLRDLAQGNRQYEDRFGHIFIVCASGKTAAEMLALLRSRLGNDPGIELKVAAAEQAKITKLRLEKL